MALISLPRGIHGAETQIQRKLEINDQHKPLPFDCRVQNSSLHRSSKLYKLRVELSLSTLKRTVTAVAQACSRGKWESDDTDDSRTSWRGDEGEDCPELAPSDRSAVFDVNTWQTGECSNRLLCSFGDSVTEVRKSVQSDIGTAEAH